MLSGWRGVHLVFMACLVVASMAHATIEINGSPYATQNAPLPEVMRTQGKKLVLIDPKHYAWGAYNAKGRLIRWGIATAGASWCADIQQSCRTKSGSFHIYSAGSASCTSSKYPVAVGGSPMPYCMYFNGGQAIHGANHMVMANKSHGCVRLYQQDAKWLRYRFIETPTRGNHYKGTRVVVKNYE